MLKLLYLQYLYVLTEKKYLQAQALSVTKTLVLYGKRTTAVVPITGSHIINRCSIAAVGNLRKHRERVSEQKTAKYNRNT